MPLSRPNRPIPEECLPIRDYIRENVERPDYLPRVTRFGLRYKGLVCPLGLLRCSNKSLPKHESHFDELPDGFDRQSIEAFVRWWDFDSGAPAVAADAVWGR